MAAQKKPHNGNGQPSEQPWWPARECWTLLGVSRQRWQRLVAEHQLEVRTDDRGVQRFDPVVVEELGDRLGLTAAQDSTVVALNVLRETIESMSEYVKLVQSSERETVKMLRDENDSLRKLRGEEQKAHWDAVVATQQALDMSEDRHAARQAQSAQEQRKDKLLTMAQPGLEKLAQQLLSTIGTKEDPRLAMLTNIVGKLGDDETAFVAVSMKLNKDEYTALQTLRGKTGDDYDTIVAPAIADAEREHSDQKGNPSG